MRFSVAADGESGKSRKANASTSKPTGSSSESSSPFLVLPSEVTLPRDSSALLHLWCLPRAEGEVSERLCLSLANNPSPLEVRVQAKGVLPRIALDRETLSLGRVLGGTSLSE